MDPVSAFCLMQAAGAVFTACSKTSIALYRLAKEIRACSETLQRLGDRVEGLGRVLGAVKQCALRISNATDLREEYNNEVITLVSQCVDECEQSLDQLRASIQSIVGSVGAQRRPRLAIQAVKFRQKKSQLESYFELLGTQKQDLTIALTTMTAHICLGLQAPPSVFEYDPFQQLVNRLQIAIEAPQPQSASQSHNGARLRSAAEKTLSTARSMSSARSSVYEEAMHADGMSLVLNTSVEDLMATLIQPLERTDSERTYVERSASSNIHSEDGSNPPLSPKTRPANFASTDYGSPIHLKTVRLLSEKGKAYYLAANFEQAYQYLSGALERWQKLEQVQRDSLDINEIRFILASTQMERRQIDEAESLLLALVSDVIDESALTHDAYFKLALLYLWKKDLETAIFYCTNAVDGRGKMEGEETEQYYDAVRLLALIYAEDGDQAASNVLLMEIPQEQPTQQSQVHRTPAWPSTSTSLALRPSASFTPRSGRSSSTATRMPSTEQSLNLLPSIRDDSLDSQADFSPNHSRNNTLMESPGRTSSKSSQENEISATLARGDFEGDFDANKALRWAIEEDHLNVVWALLEGHSVPRKRRFNRGTIEDGWFKKAFADGSNGGKFIPLMAAIERENEEMVRLLLEHRAATDTKDLKGQSPLLLAAKLGNAKLVETLLNNGAPAEGCEASWTPLHVAADKNHIRVAKILLDRGANKDCRDRSGQTPIRIVAAKGLEQLLRLLLEFNADVDAVNDEFWTPLMSSVKSGHGRITSILLANRASTNLQNNKGETALIIAASEGRFEQVQALADGEANLDIADKHGHTALIVACDRGHAEIAFQLVRSGANKNARAVMGATALDYALSLGQTINLDLAKWLKEQGAEHGSGVADRKLSVSNNYRGYTLM